MHPAVTTGSIRESADRACRFRPIAGRGFRAAVEITRRCNIACLHCFVPNERNDPELANLLAVIESLQRAGCRKLILTGGEPLLRADLEQIIRKATEVGIGVDLNSNLYNLSTERAEALVQAGLVEASTSFYGDEQFHDRFVRRTGAFDSTLQSCRLLRERGVTLDIHGPVWADNLKFVEYLYDLALSVGADSMTLFRVVGLTVPGADQRFGETRFETPADQFPPPSLVELGAILERLRRRGDIPLRTIGFWGTVCEECEQGNSIVGLTSDLTLSPCLLSRRDHPQKYIVDGGNVEQVLALLRKEVAAGRWEPVCDFAPGQPSGESSLLPILQ